MAFITGCADAEQREGQQLTKADQTFFSQLRDAVKNDNRGWVADHVSFPINIKIGGEQRAIKTRQEFLVQYESVFNDKVRRAIEIQQPDALFKNWRGLMVGNGEIWFTAVRPDPIDPQRIEYYIIGINN
jgi:hypothetical protein